MFSSFAARQVRAMGGGLQALSMLLALCCAIGLATMAGSQAAVSKPGKYGKTLVAAYDLPVETLAQFSRFAPKKGSNPATIYADTLDWTGTALNMAPAESPYTLVIKVSGVVKEDGDANAWFQPGWAGDTGKRTSLVLDAGKPGAKAGEVLQRDLAIAPISVNENKALAPALGFSGAKNMDVTGVSIEVWSGMAKTSLVATLMAWSPLLGGLVFLGLFLWWRR